MVTLAWPMIRLSCTGSLSEWYEEDRWAAESGARARWTCATPARSAVRVARGGGLVGSCVDPNFPGTSRPTYGNRCQMGNRVTGDGRSRFEGEWQIRVTPEASMTDAENVTVARFSVTAERGFL